jgi:hypothetical protein
LRAALLSALVYVKVIGKGGGFMEKIFWVTSAVQSESAKSSDGLEVVNRHLDDGWEVKYISACAMGNFAAGQAYVVLEKFE